MVHVDVKRRPERDGYTIEVSVDGAKWLEHWFLPSRGTYEVDRDLTAKADASHPRGNRRAHRATNRRGNHGEGVRPRL